MEVSRVCYECVLSNFSACWGLEARSAGGHSEFQRLTKTTTIWPHTPPLDSRPD